MDLQITNALYNIILVIITTGMPIIITYAVSFIKQHASSKQLQKAQSIAISSVTYAQQVSSQLGLNNEAKLNSALASARTLASSFGLKLSDDQWKNLLEPALKEAKKGWNDVTKDDAPIVVSEPTQTVSGDSVSVLEEVDTLNVPNNMMQDTYDQIKAKATSDAELAVKSVLENVSKSIAVAE